MDNKMIDFNEIYVFIKVVEATSFTKAAKILNMPNSTVSARISSLEERLGVTLLYRTTRQLNLTPEGKNYYQQAILGFKEILQAEEELKETGSSPQGSLKITAPHLLGNILLPQIITSFTKRYPQIKIELRMSDHEIDLIANGIDLAIRAGKLKDSSLISKRLGIAYFAPFASPQYLKQFGEPKHPKDLSKHQCLQFSSLGLDKWEFENAKQRASVPLKGNIISDDLFLIKTMTLNHSGISLMPTLICEQEVKRGRLIRLLPEWTSLPRPIHFVYPNGRFTSKNLNAFLELAFNPLKEKLLACQF